MIFNLYNYLKNFNDEVLSMNDEIEIWESVGVYNGINYGDDYEISTFGNARSVKRKNGCISYHKLSPYTNTNGYKQIILSHDGVERTVRLHRLVAIRFIPNPNNYNIVNHIDENKLNNNVNNLEWCDSRYNSTYGTVLYRRSETRKNKFIPIVQLDMNCNIINVYYRYSHCEIFNDCEYYLSMVSRAINNETYIYKNCFWIKLDEYNNLSKEDLLKLVNNKNIEYNKRIEHKPHCTKKRKVVKLDDNNNFIEAYNSIGVAADNNKCSHQSIWACLQGKRQLCKGYNWMYLEDYEKLSNNKIVKIVDKEISGNRNFKKVVQTKLNGEFIKEWNSIKEAANELGINAGNISSCLKGRYSQTGGFKWVYSKDYYNQ